MDEIKPLLLLIVSALLIRQTLIYCGQGWAKSYSQTMKMLKKFYQNVKLIIKILKKRLKK